MKTIDNLRVALKRPVKINPVLAGLRAKKKELKRLQTEEKHFEKAKPATPRKNLPDALIEFSKMLKVPEGMNVGEPFQLRKWQMKMIKPFGRPVLRRLIISMPRKNGKTAFVAFLVVAALSGPLAVRNGTCYSAARSRDQAALVFKLASNMIRQNEWLRARITIRQSVKELYCPATGVTYKALSAETTTAMGLSPFLVIHDELGQVTTPTDSLYDALETAGGAQAHFLSIVISTQAPNDTALLSTLIDDAMANPQDEATELVFFGADPEADPYDEKTWKKANPAYGDFLNARELAQAAARARRLPSMEASFLNLHLNRRIGQNTSYLAPRIWAENAGEIDKSLFYKYPVFIGIDLSTHLDLTAAVLRVEDEDKIIHLWPEYWTPAEGLAEREETYKAPYTAWVHAGLMRTTQSGAGIDYDTVVQHLLEITRGMKIAEVRVDRWRMEDFKISCNRMGARWDVIGFGQGFRDMAPALDNFEKAMLEKQVRHGNHPILRWNFSNCKVIRDPAGNRKLDKRNWVAKIDGAISTIMACAVFDADRANGGISNYEKQPLQSVGGIREIAIRTKYRERDPFEGLDDEEA